MTDQLFPRPPRRMKQPRKDVLREQLALAATTIERQRNEIARLASIAPRARGPAYYNENDPYVAQWLRNLIARGLIPAGDVDTRSIVDVQPDDLIGYRQCHFFAGIGGWALAARLAGWPDDRELWTGSCPCQPFSGAGKGLGHDDERHLWPHQFRLLRARRPAVWMGEQVAAAVGKDWLDGVLADVEAIGYAGRAAVVPACAVDGPHRRDRLWIVAERDGAVGYGERARLEGHAGHGHAALGWAQPSGSAAATGRGSDVADAAGGGREQGLPSTAPARHGRVPATASSPGGSGGMADANRLGRQINPHAGGREDGGRARPFAGSICAGDGDVGNALRWRQHEGIDDEAQRLQRHPVDADLANASAWSGAGWILGHDGKARRVEPSIRLLAHGVPARVGRLRAYGNAIVPQVAAEVIAAYIESTAVAQLATRHNEEPTA